MRMARGDLNRRVRIERPIVGEAFDAGNDAWETVATVWAQVQDMLPSRGERLADGVNVSARPARVRMDYRDGLAANMRFVEGTRIMQIISGPAELGFHETLEFMVEDFGAASATA